MFFECLHIGLVFVTDPSGRNGAGCDLCKMWWDARDEVDRLLKDITGLD